MRTRVLTNLLRWETVLAIAILADMVLNTSLSPYFLTPSSLSDATFNFTEKALVALPLALLIVAGEIDISVAGIIALASVAMGLAAQAGAASLALVAVGLGTGLLAGLFNGVLVTVLRVPSIVATIGTMSLYRGAASAILGDQALKHYPADFAFFGQGYVAWVISFELLVFAVVAAFCAVVLHGSIAGKRIYAIGANPVAARFSGVAVGRHRFALFCLVGLAAGAASVLLTSRLGSTRPSIAQGWELDIISMVILGGVAVTGGRGTILGVVLAAILVGFVTFGLGLLNVPGIALSLIMGALLIAVVAAPQMAQMVTGRIRSR
jgi:rhamnose transport system permease protein